METTIQLMENIERALQKRNKTNVQSDKPEVVVMPVNYPTLEEQSEHWTLNMEQHMSFVLMGAALLQHLLNINSVLELPEAARYRMDNINHLISDILPASGQLILFLGGSGGTGKTRVIQALVDFARRWNASSSLITSASSGIAAMLIGGCTIHSALGIQRTLHPPDPTVKQIAKWTTIGLLLVDEFSMIRAGLFDLIDSRLRQLKTRFNKLFGGLHLVFCGDFYQLPPVGTTVFRLPTFTDNQHNPNALASLRGQQLWNTCLSDVILLSKNLRQSEPAWAESLLRWRTNEPTEEDIAQVNSRLLTNEQQLPPTQQHTLAAVSENSARENGLRYCESQLLVSLQPIAPFNTDWRSRGVLLIQATITTTRGNQPVSSDLEAHIRDLPAKRLGAAGNLLCVLGCNYIINRNEDVSKGVANGTTAKLLDVILKDQNQIRVVQLHGHKVHAVFADQIVSLIFHHNSPFWQKSACFTILPIGCFPLIPQQQQIKCRFGKNNETFNIKVKQPLCELAVVLT